MVRKLGRCLVLLVLSLQAWAADHPGSISGVVRSVSGFPQMGAAVEIFTSASRSVTVFTDARGFYAAPGLRPGTYAVRVSAPSFMPATRERLTLHAGAALVVNLTLNTIFETLNVSPRGAGTEDDDWKWTLRSIANRPVLRAIDPTLAAEEDPDSRLKATVAFMAGADSQGYGGSPEMSTNFTLEHSLFSYGSITFGGNVGYGADAPAATLRTTYSHRLPNGSTPEISFIARRLAPSDPALRDAALTALSMRVSDSMNLGDVIELKFGSEMQTMQFMKRTGMVLPFGSASVHLNPNTVVAYSYASSEPASHLARERELLPVSPMETGPRVSVSGFAPAMQRAGHHEISVSRRMGKNNLMLAAYKDRIRDTALVGIGQASAASGEILPDIYSGTFTYQGPDVSFHGWRAVYDRKINSLFDATFDYAYGGVIELPGPKTSLEESRYHMRTTQRHAMGARMTGILPGAKTKWCASYRWTSGQALTPVDAFNASAGQMEPFLNLTLRQPIPSMGFLPLHLEALVDVRNLLAEGYVPVVSSQDNRTVYLVQAGRAVRGGVAITF